MKQKPYRGQGWEAMDWKKWRCRQPPALSIFYNGNGGVRDQTTYSALPGHVHYTSIAMKNATLRALQNVG